mgnify:CR=1 FL=1
MFLQIYYRQIIKQQEENIREMQYMKHHLLIQTKMVHGLGDTEHFQVNNHHSLIEEECIQIHQHLFSVLEVMQVML